MGARALKLLTFGLIMALGPVACGPGDKPDEHSSSDTGEVPKIIHYGNTGEPLSLDPHKASGQWENYIIGDMFLGLYTENPEGEPVYGLAQSHTVSDDGLTWTFEIREAQWSDGTPISAADGVYGLRRILKPETAAQYATLLYPIKNAEAVNTGSMPPESLGVRATDDRTLVMELEAPAPYLPGLLTHYTSFPLPRHVAEEHGDDWIKPEHIAVSGPYKLAEWRTNNFVHVKKNPVFFDAENVCIDEIYYYPTNDANAAIRRVLAGAKRAHARDLKSGELHLNTEIPGLKIDSLRKSLPGYVRTHPYISTIYLSFNTTQEPFTDARVRRALSMAIDRDFLVNKVVKGGRVPAHSLVPPGIANYKGEKGPKPEWASWPMDKRRTEAKRLLEDAGFGPDNPLRFEYTHRNTGDNPKAAPILQSDWSKIAPWVKVTIASVELQIHYENLRTGNFEVGDGGWVADFNDPQNYLFLLESRTDALNYSNYSNPDYDVLVAKSANILNMEARADVLAEAEAVMLRDMPISPIWFDSNRNLVHPDITGFVDNVVDIHRARYMCFRE